MLTPEEQMNAAMASVGAPPPQLLSHQYNRPHEQQGIGLAAGMSQLPVMAGVASGVGLSIAGMLSTSKLGDAAIGLFDPFTAILGRHMTGRSIGTRLMAATPALAFTAATTYGAQQLTNRMIEGQQELVASRQLMRELPAMADPFGSMSLLSNQPGGSLRHASNSHADVLRFNQSVSAVGGGFGMDSAASRNTISALGAAGAIDTRNIETASASFRKTLQELQRVQRVLQTDLQSAATVYADMSRNGVTGTQALGLMNQMGGAAILTGRAYPQVAQMASMASAYGQERGIDARIGFSVGLNALTATALQQSRGTLDSRYVARMGGVDNVVQRMAEVRLGVASSPGSLAVLRSLYDTTGADRQNSTFLSSARLGSAHSFMRDVDPYELQEMQDRLTAGQAGAVLGRVSAIRANARNRRSANRSQYEFLSSLGISDPTEQLQYLESLRSEGASRFMGAVQGVQNSALTRSNANTNLQTETANFRDILRQMNEGISRDLRALGQSLLIASEEAMLGLSGARNQSVRLSTGGVSVSGLQRVQSDLMSGNLILNTTTPISDARRMISMPGAASAISRSANMQGVDFAAQRANLPALAQMYAAVAVDLPNYIERNVSRLGQSVIQNAASYAYSADYADPFAPVSGGFSNAARQLGYQGYGGAIGTASGRTMTPDQYIDVFARSLGQRYSAESGTLMRAQENDIARLMETRAGRLETAATQAADRIVQLGRPTLGGVLEGTEGLSSITGRATRSLLAADPRRSIGLNYAAAGMTGIVHLGAMAYDLFNAGSGAVADGAARFNDSMGVQRDTTLDEAHIRLLRASPERQRDALNTMAQAAYGREYAELDSRQQLTLRAYLSRQRPDMARGLSLVETDMTDMEFTAALSQNTVQDILESTFRTERSGQARGVGQLPTDYAQRLGVVRDVARSGSAIRFSTAQGADRRRAIEALYMQSQDDYTRANGNNPFHGRGGGSLFRNFSSVAVGSYVDVGAGVAGDLYSALWSTIDGQDDLRQLVEQELQGTNLRAMLNSSDPAVRARAVNEFDTAVREVQQGGAARTMGVLRGNQTALSSEDIERNRDFYLGELGASSFMAQGSSAGDVFNMSVEQLRMGGGDFGNRRAAASSMVNAARLGMQFDLNEVGGSTAIPTAVLALEVQQRLAQVPGLSDSQRAGIMAEVGASISSAPDITYGDTVRQRQSISEADPAYLRNAFTSGVEASSIAAQATFGAARESIQTQNLQYLRSRYQDDMTNLIAGDSELGFLLAGENLSDTNTIYDVMERRGTDATNAFNARINGLNQRIQEAASRGDTAERRRLEQQRDSIRFASTLVGANGPQTTDTAAVQAYAQRAIFGSDGRVSQEGIQEVNEIYQSQALANFGAYLGGPNNASTREMFEQGLREVGFADAEGQATEGLRSFAEQTGMDLTTRRGESTVDAFTRQIRDNQSAQMELVRRLLESGNPVVAAAAQETADKETQRAVNRHLAELLPRISDLVVPQLGVQTFSGNQSGGDP